MSVKEQIQTNQEDPAALERLFRENQKRSEVREFEEGIESVFAQNPGSLLLQAWHYRLTFEPEAVRAAVNWMLAIALSITTGLALWGLSFDESGLLGEVPAFFFLWAPVTTLLVLVYFYVETPENRRRVLIFGGLLAVVVAYALIVGRSRTPFSGQYPLLLVIHIPFLAWAAIGMVLTRTSHGRFAFIRKSLEVFVTGGLYLGAGIIFGVITVGMFAALDVTLPEPVLRLIAAGGAGLLPMIAVVSVYDAHRRPAEQSFGQGVGRLVPILTQLLLPLTFLVMLIYIFVIPFNFFSPFEDRDVLIVYNVMLFAVMGMLVGATPAAAEDIAPALRPWVRRAIIAVAGLAVLISLYALSAVVYRTLQGGWTANRITVIGWNTINIGVLVAIVIGQLRLKRQEWANALKNVFGQAAVAYLAWALALVVLLPLIAALR